MLYSFADLKDHFDTSALSKGELCLQSGGVDRPDVRRNGELVTGVVFSKERTGPSSWVLRARPSLVVVPTSLLATWRDAVERFTPDLRLLILHGPRRHEQMLRIPDQDRVLTTYPLLGVGQVCCDPRLAGADTGLRNSAKLALPMPSIGSPERVGWSWIPTSWRDCWSLLSSPSSAEIEAQTKSL